MLRFLRSRNCMPPLPCQPLLCLDEWSPVPGVLATGVTEASSLARKGSLVRGFRRPSAIPWATGGGNSVQSQRNHEQRGLRATKVLAWNTHRSIRGRGSVRPAKRTSTLQACSRHLRAQVQGRSKEGWDGVMVDMGQGSRGLAQAVPPVRAPGAPAALWLGRTLAGV